MWLELQIFGFRALWSPYFLSFLIILGLLYYLITGPYRHKFGGAEAGSPTVAQHTSFYLGLVLLYAVKGAPVDLLSHIMLTAHMTQMAIYLLLVPILLIKGIPKWLWEKFAELPVVKQILNVFTNPIVSLLFFNGLFSFYHVPFVFDFSKATPIAHATISLILFTAAFLMWFSIIPPLEKYNRLSPLQRIFTIFINGILITPACVLIIFAGNPLYTAYTSEGSWLTALSICVPGDVLDGIYTELSGPEMFSPLKLIHDQQLGGIIMKSVQELIYGIIMAKTFFSWFNKEKLKVDPKISPAGDVK